MTNPIVREHNQKTGEIIDREMTDAEVADMEAAIQERLDAIAAEEAKKQATLDKLGLTAEELRAALA